MTLTAAPSQRRLADVEFPGFLYNNAYLPPLLRVRLGDVLRVRLRNKGAHEGAAKPGCDGGDDVEVAAIIGRKLLAELSCDEDIAHDRSGRGPRGFRHESVFPSPAIRRVAARERAPRKAQGGPCPTAVAGSVAAVPPILQCTCSQLKGTTCNTSGLLYHE